ncbi:MAG: galactoside ABC transporter permease [Treponema sp.]|nr:galactoside ABC transporter permease [Treponema sp.]
MANQLDELKSFDDDSKLVEYSEKLNELRKDGVNKVTELRQAIAAAKKNKMLDAETRVKIINNYKEQIVKAQEIAAANKAEDKRLTKEAVAYANGLAKNYQAQVKEVADKEAAVCKKDYEEAVAKIVADGQRKEQEIVNSKSDTLKEDLAAHKFEVKSALADAKSHYNNGLYRCKTAIHQAFVDHVQKNISLRNSKTNFGEDFQLGLKNYAYQFTPQKFFLANGLYIAILIFFIVCIILAPISGNGNLLSLPNILTILEQSSVRMFYALGVAGLILLAGTDLSVGRMVAMGAVCTGLILHPGTNIVTFLGLGPWDFTALPMLSRVLLSVFLSVVLCSLFTAIAGFFSAYFKMHPFISTLATQLIIYGLLFFGTSGTPVGSIDGKIKDLLGGRWILGYVGDDLITFPKLIIPAVIAIIIAWFVWNKTTFGKNMYAVGGNAEAASVSGISVFWVTLRVFIMAGIFYGFGAFFEAFKANASAGTGQGYEMDAIAACVVGGISFNGGIGKIGGAVLGVIIFTGLTYCLTFLGIDTNLQFVFKGLIILAAVSLDCVKYLKRK